jgi:predicted acylesterase/phospholipase RssA/CRP-like cAMP-binding protein
MTQTARGALAASPLFSDLPLNDPTLAEVNEVVLRAGEVLFHQGDGGALAYLVARGVIGLYRSDVGRETRLFRKACTGELFGEYALLCDEPRSATARALVDCTVLAIDQACLSRLLSLESHLPSRLIRHLALAASRGREDLSNHPLISVVAPTRHLSRLQDPALEELLSTLEACATVMIADHRHDHWGREEQSKAIVAALERRQPCVFIVDSLDVLDREHWPLIDRALLVCRDNTVDPADMGIAAREHGCGATGPAVDLVRIWPASQNQPDTMPPEQRQGLECLRHVYNLREDRTQDYQRTARCILGIATVLVLGGGGAKGFAHIGALRALEEVGTFQIDMVFGISIGSLVGSLYCMGQSLTAIREQLLNVFVRRTPYSLTLPIHSLFRYNHHLHLAEQILKDLDVGDTWIPFRPGSVDLTSNQLVFWHRHSLLQTVLASMSIPGLAPPMPMPLGALHVDGAVLDNLPILEARRCTSGQVIAISLDHGEGQRTLSTLGSQHAWLWRLLQRFGIVRSELPSIATTILQAMLCSARLKSDREEHFANVLLKPNLTHIGILEWSAHEEVEQEGYRSMIEKLSCRLGSTACKSQRCVHSDQV